MQSYTDVQMDICLMKTYSDVKRKKTLNVKKHLILYKKDLKLQQLPFKCQNWIVSLENGHFRFRVGLCHNNVYLVLANYTKCSFVFKGNREINNQMGITFLLLVLKQNQFKKDNEDDNFLKTNDNIQIYEIDSNCRLVLQQVVRIMLCAYFK